MSDNTDYTDNEISESIKFRGKIEHVTWYSDESAWGVVVVSVDSPIPYAKEKTTYDLTTNTPIKTHHVTLKGKMPKPQKGVIWDVDAHWVYEEKYKAYQYEIENIYHNVPKTANDMRLYLESILTPKQVETLTSVYPNIVDDVVNGTENVDLNLLSGFGQMTWDRVKDKIVENFAISDILALLTPLGISYSKIKKLLAGESNPIILKQRLINNPYKLTEIDGISFKVADKIAIQLNPTLKESLHRLTSFVGHCLTSIGNSEGHAYVDLGTLRSEVIENVAECEKFLDEYIEAQRLFPTFLHVTDKTVGLLEYYNTEKFIYEFLNEVHTSEPLIVTTDNVENGIKKSEAEQGFEFSKEQKEVLYNMVGNNLNILSGFGGSGKSSLSRGILNIYNDAGYSIAVCALSAKASKRATETTGYSGTTIHRLLGSDGRSFVKNESSKLEADVVLCDESSMNNSIIFKALFQAIDSKKTKVILVGDNYQLPPIQFGQVFTDLLTTENAFQKNVLTKPHRQKKDSGIFIDAMKMRMGENPLNEEEMSMAKVVHGDNDMIYVFSDDKEYLHSLALSSYQKAVEEDGVEEVVILSPRKKTVLNSTEQFNKEVQSMLYPNDDASYTYGKKKFVKGDRVIQISNDVDKSVYNGYTGKVIDVKVDGITSEFDDGTIADHDKDDISSLELGYSISCHRSQGSEYQSVIVVLDMSSYMLLFSEMLYTARTRGKKRVLILAQPKAYELCLRESKSKRNTWLKGFLENDNKSFE